MTTRKIERRRGGEEEIGKIKKKVTLTVSLALSLSLSTDLLSLFGFVFFFSTAAALSPMGRSRETCLFQLFFFLFLALRFSFISSLRHQRRICSKNIMPLVYTDHRDGHCHDV